MPEGNSSHLLARKFQGVFAGHPLHVSSPQGRFTAGASRLDRQVLEYARAYGKQLFLHFGNELVLRVHLGLYGAWDFGGDEAFIRASSALAQRAGEEGVLLAGGTSDVAADGADVEYAKPQEPRGAVRVRLVSAHGWADLHGATACEVLTPAEAAAIVAALGPDPLYSRPGDGVEFVRRVQGSRSPIALLLMNQQILAGVGNVYRAELLFRQRMNPWLPGTGLSAQQLNALWQDVVSVMPDGVRAGRIITTLPQDRPSHAVPVPVEEAHYVYQRNGLPCRICGTDIASTGLGNRKLYWCPCCQRLRCRQETRPDGA
ncbi:DNA glycosylase [Paenarthrobacter sp. PH39-S1]|uniref:Fpg/Nei family DNA glycosylase n=1 Tax=Paenarthrobacter sp. PH39-S1 TaxID=3046204 RepID=UPI0024BAE7A8|nr:DNA glycosylase [Paenarthrobacter sp. PH39-S1]MDJ0358232.1 zinc finger domain-containing protein [Paenarthrobacter sp. PH39-S1]